MSDIAEAPPAIPFVPVCAIGASAGGVTALQALFRRLPVDLGLAYVVILHLSPDQPSALTEILASCTRMSVLQVEDGPTLKPNCVYVIPPDRELVIQGDSVMARAFTEPRWQRAPIDMFFRSIAAGRGDGIAVVLSGAGSDGASGVRAVKEAGGVILVQEPAEAGFGSMPQNAIATGAVDFVAPIHLLAERLADVARSKEAVRSLDMDSGADDLRRIVAFLRARTGHDFAGYKRATVMRRVQRRMQVCRTVTLGAYADYLLTTPEEARELFSDLLISVTQFFRDPGAFVALERVVVGPLLEDLDLDAGIRAWVVGCATGEEVYSLAMLLHEEAARRKVHPQIQIFATDLDEGALATAREGRYPRSIEADVSEERLTRFFINETTHYRVRKELRDSVLFAAHSAIKEPPFMRLDLIACRNLLIYLERPLQQQLCTIFHYALKPGKFLFLGSAETADAVADMFAPLDREARIYGKRPHALHTLPILPQFAAPERFATLGQPHYARMDRTDLPVALHFAALERDAPPSVLVDDAQNIVHLSSNAGQFILPSGGVLSSLLPAMVRPELRLDLRIALTRALEGKEPTLTLPVSIAMDRGTRRIAMHVVPVSNAAHMSAQALVLFLDGGGVAEGEQPDSAPDTRPDEVRRLHAELKAAQEALVASRSGQEAAVQDLRASNEELQSINEEYRSTAEELETSKEELQSINEELHTVNAELKSKLASISVAHSDLQNLMTATEIGTLFLDLDLRIRMFTSPIAELFNVTAADIGRTITDFTHRLEYDGLEADARHAMRSLASIETEMRSKDGLWFVMKLRPYRTLDNHIDGTVVSFVDITARREAEAARRESEARLAAMFEVLPVGVAICDTAGKLTLANPEMLRFMPGGEMPIRDETRTWRWKTHDADGQLVEVQEFPGAQALRGEAVLPGVELLYQREDGREIWTQVAAVPIRGGEGRIAGHISIVADIDASKRNADALRASEERFRQFGEASQDLLWIRDAQTFQWEYLTAAFEVIYGLQRDTALRGDTMGNWLDLILPEDQQRALANLKRVRDGEWVKFEFRIRRASDGQIRWLRNTDFPIHDGTGKVVRIGGIGQDITELKRTEQALGETELRQRALVEGIPQLVWRAVDGGHWSWSSPQWTRYTGQSEADSHGWGWLQMLHPDDRDAAREAWIAALTAGVFEAEHRLWRAASKSYRWFQTRATPVRDAAGSIIEWLGASSDIDDLRGYQERLAVLVSELQHRTRNLMGVVKSTADLTLRSSFTLDEFGAKFSDRLTALARVQGVLSRLNEGERVTFDELISAEFNALGHPDGSDRVSLDGPMGVALRSSSVQVFGMALHELATNAVKYGALGQAAGHLTVTWRLQHQTEDGQPWLHVEWRETGVTMPPAGDVPRGGGAGRTLIERALPYQLGAKTTYVMSPDGVRCSISLPVSQQPGEGGTGNGHHDAK